MIVAIDGPAGAGKSVLARKLAGALAFGFLDTGAMYRAATLACMRADVDLSIPSEVSECILSSNIEFSENSILLNGEEIVHLIRLPEVSRAIRPVADNPQVREHMVELQRFIVGNGDYVTEGRDQATIAFPNADCKIYLTASPEERALRRQLQLASSGIEVGLEEILAEQQQRDHDDMNRPVGSLKVADDSIYVHTDGMHEEDVLQKLIEIVNKCRKAESHPSSA
jgi:cytidylate kinase